MMDMQQAALAISRQVAAATETACEKALVGGTCGVLVVRLHDGSYLIGPHPKVPYGQIADFPNGMRDDVAAEYGL